MVDSSKLAVTPALMRTTAMPASNVAPNASSQLRKTGELQEPDPSLAATGAMVGDVVDSEDSASFVLRNSASSTATDLSQAALNAASLIGETVTGESGSYKIESPIGKGGMGVVYLGRDKDNGKVAIKVLSPQVLLDEKAVTRFFIEADSMKKMTTGYIDPTSGRKYIVKYIDHGQQGDQPFIVMEHIDGKSMEDALKNRDITVGQALLSYAKVLRAIKTIHEAGAVHRDIKPDNIFLIMSGEMHNTKVHGHHDSRLGDFGLIRTGDPALTEQGTILGTPNYMAPEQIFNPGEITYKADEYSAALVLYSIIAGGSPFEGANIMNTIGRITQGPGLPPISEINPAARGLQPIFDQYLRLEPNDRKGRYSDLNQVANLIERVVHSGGLIMDNYPHQNLGRQKFEARIRKDAIRTGNDEVLRALLGEKLAENKFSTVPVK